MWGIAWHLCAKEKSGNMKGKHSKLRRQEGARDLKIPVRILHDSEKDGSLDVINQGSNFRICCKKILI